MTTMKRRRLNATSVARRPKHEKHPARSWDAGAPPLLLGLFHGVPMTRKAYLTYRWGPITSCFIRRILKRSAPARPKSANKFA
jgi:hypothetical protein